MTVRDPRQVYDDLIVDRVEREADSTEFAALHRNEAFRSGWVAGGVVVDDDGRVLLVYHGDDDAWLTPGGTLAPGESLREALVRKVREETGVQIRPGRPHALVESVVRYKSKHLRFRYVMFCSHATDMTEDDDLNPAEDDDFGESSEPTREAKWFEELPDNVYGGELTERVLARCRSELNDSDE